MYKSNHRKILLTLLSFVFAICCIFATQILYTRADDGGSTETALSGDLSNSISYDALSVTEDTVAYLNGCTITIGTSITVADGATLQIYAGTSTDASENYLLIGGGQVSGSFYISQNSYGSITVSGSSVSVSADVDLYGTISVTTFTISSGELYVNNASADVNGGYALTASALNVMGGATIMQGSNTSNDVYIDSSSVGSFCYTKGSFYANKGVNVTAYDLSENALTQCVISMKIYEYDTSNDNKVFKAVSKVYLDGNDYSVVISDTTDTSKTGSNYVSLYVTTSAKHTVSIVDGDGLWATYSVTYDSGSSTFTITEQDEPQVDLYKGSVTIYSNYYTQNNEDVLWGGEYDFIVSNETNNSIEVVSDEDIIISFTGGGTFTANTVISFSKKSDSGTPNFTVKFDDAVYNFGSNTAISITGGSLTLCESSDSSSYSNVTLGGLSVNNATLTMNGGNLSCANKNLVNVTGGKFILNAGSINGGACAIYAQSSSTVTINGGEVTDNTASYAAIYLLNSTLNVNGGTIYGNTGDLAGAVYADNSTLNLNGGVITGNYCTKTDGGAAVMCSSSTCSADGAFIYGNYKNINNIIIDCTDLYGDGSSSVKIVSGIISSYYGATLSSGTVSYTVPLDDIYAESDTITIKEVALDSATYILPDDTLSVSELYVYGGNEYYKLLITDAADDTYTYELFTSGGSGLAAKLVSSLTASLPEGQYYLSGNYDSITVTGDTTIYLEAATITTLTISSGVNADIYIIDANAVTTLSGGGSAAINGSGSIAFTNAVTATLTVNSGVVNLGGQAASLIVNGGGFLNVDSTSTAEDADGNELKLLSLDFTPSLNVTAVTVDGTDYGIAYEGLTSLSLFLTKEDHTVTVSAGDKTYIYSVSWSAGTAFTYDVTDGDFLYDLSGDSITITASGYMVGSSETAFTGSYILQTSTDTINTITVDGNARLTLSGVTAGSLAINVGTVYIYLTDGTTNTLDSITVASGATLYVYCAYGKTHTCTDNCGILCAQSLSTAGTFYLYGGILEIDEVQFTSGTGYVYGGEINDSAITVAGALYLYGGEFTGVQLTVTGSVTMTGGTVTSSEGSTLGSAITLNGGSLAMSGGTINGNSELASGGAVSIDSTSTFTLNGGIVDGGVYVNLGTLTVNGGVITQADGDGTIVINGGYVYGDFLSVVNSDGDTVFLIEIVLPESMDIGDLTIKIAENSYSIGQSYTSGVLYVYGGGYATQELECSVKSGDITYIYELQYDYTDMLYYLPSQITIDVSEDSYVLCENGYYLYEDSENLTYAYVSYGDYLIVQSNASVCYTLYSSGNVTAEFYDTVNMLPVCVLDAGIVISGQATFSGGVSSGETLIIDGTFTAAYVDSTVVLQSGSLTLYTDGSQDTNIITSDGSVTVEDGEFSAQGVEGTLKITGGYVTIANTIPSTATVIIDGGSVKASFASTPKNSSGNYVYLFAPDISLYIEDEIYSVLVDSTEYNVYGSYTEIYLYLTAQSHVVSIESYDAYLVYNLVYSNGEFTDYEYGVLDISAGNVVITSSGYYVDDVYTAYQGDYVFLQSIESTDDRTENTITVDGATVTIYLYGVAICTTESYAISAINGANVTIVLPDDMDNVVAAFGAGIYVGSGSTINMSCAHAEEEGHDDCSYCGVLYGDTFSGLFYVEGTLNINGGYYMGGIADYGGAIYVDGGTVNIGNGIFYYNQAYYGGAVYVESGTVNIYGGFIYSNYAVEGGAVYLNSGKLYITSGDNIQSNEANLGGAIYVNGGTATIYSGYIYANEASYGGALYIAEGAAANIYGGFISLNEGEDGAAVYVLGTLKVYGGLITEDNEIYVAEGASARISGGVSSVCAYGELYVTGGSVNVLHGTVLGYDGALYCLEISLDGLLALEIDGTSFDWDFDEALSSATLPDSLYIWVDSSAHLIAETSASGTEYYIAVFGGTSFTLHSATYLEVNSNTEITDYGYYYLDVTASSLTLDISSSCTVFISGYSLLNLNVASGCVVSVYGLAGYEIANITVNGMLISGGVSAQSATVADGCAIKISDSQIYEITLGESSSLILGDGEINVTYVYISEGSLITVSGTVVLTGIITIDFADGVTPHSALFADASAADYSKYFVSGDSNYSNILKESGGLRMSLSVVTLTISVTGGSVYIDGTQYSGGDSVSLAVNASYSITYSPDVNYYLSSVTLDGKTLSTSTISLEANAALVVVYSAGVAAAYSNGGNTYVGAYETLEKTLANGSYVLLLKNSSETVTITGNVTLDLNGYTATNITVSSDVTLIVTGEGSLSVTNNGTLNVYGGIISVTGSGDIISYGGAFTSDSLTVKDGDGTALTATKLSLPANTEAVYIDSTSYNVSTTSAKDVCFYLPSDSAYAVIDGATGYTVYSITSAEALTDYTVYDVSAGFVNITAEGSYFIFQSGTDVYGVTINASGTVTVILDALTLQSAGCALNVVSGTATITCVNCDLDGAIGAIIVSGGTVTLSGAASADIIVGGGSVEISGEYDGDVTVKGGTLKVTGQVNGDITINSGTFTTSSSNTAAVNGTVTVNGGKAELTSSISGDVIVNGGTVTVYCNVSGSLTVNGGTVNVVEARVYGSIAVYDGTFIVEQYLSVASGLIISGGDAQLYDETIGDVTLRGGTLTINSVLHGALNINGGALTVTSGIFHGAVNIGGGTAYINGGLFVGSVTVSSSAYCVISGGAFAYEIDGRTLCKVALDSDSITSFEIDSNAYTSLSITLPESAIYLVGGYSLTINDEEVEYTISTSSIPSEAAEITEATISTAGTYYIGSYTGDLTISAEAIIYLDGCLLGTITVSSAVTVNIIVIGGTNVIGTITKGDESAIINIYVNGGLLYVTGSYSADSVTMNGGIITAPANTETTRTITASGNYLLNGFSGDIVIDYTPEYSETIDIYLQNCTVTSITVTSTVTVNIYVLSGTNEIASVSGTNVNIIVENGTLYTTPAVSTDIITANGGTYYVVIDSNYNTEYTITAGGNYYLNGFTGTLTISADDDVNIYISGGIELSGIAVTTAVTVNIYSLDGTNTIGSITKTYSRAVINVLVESGKLTVSGTDDSDTLSLYGNEVTIIDKTITDDTYTIYEKGSYYIVGFTGSLYIQATEEVNIYLSNDSKLADITINGLLTVNIYALGGTNTITSITRNAHGSEVNIIVESGSLTVSGSTSADSISSAGTATDTIDTENWTEITSSSYGIDEAGSYYVDGYTGYMYIHIESGTTTDVVYLYLADGTSLESISIMSDVTLNIYVLGDSYIEYIYKNENNAADAVINIYVYGGTLTIDDTHEVDFDSTTVDATTATTTTTTDTAETDTDITVELIESTHSGYILAAGSYLVDGFTGTLYINYAPSDSEVINIYLTGSSLNSIRVVSAVTVNIYVLSGSNTLTSINKNSSAVVNIFAYGGLLYASGAITADSITLDGGMVAAGSFANASPCTDATLAVIDISGNTESVSYVWITGPDDAYGFALNNCAVETLYLWYSGELEDSFAYSATVLFEDNTTAKVNLCYTAESGIIATMIAEDAINSVFTNTTVSYGSTWIVDASTYSVQYLVDGSWVSTAPTAVGSYSVRLVATVCGYNVYTTYDSWVVTVSSTSVTLTWSNTDVLDDSGFTISATTSYNIEITLTYYDYYTLEQLTAAPTAAGVYLVVAECSEAGYTITNPEAVFVIGNYDLSSTYASTQLDVTTTTDGYTYSMTGRYIYVGDGVAYVSTADGEFMVIYSEEQGVNKKLDIGELDVTYYDVVIYENGFEYGGVRYTGEVSEYTLTGSGEQTNVTVYSGTAYINLDSCTLSSIEGDGIIVITVLNGMSSVKTISAAMVIINDGGLLSGALSGAFVTDGTVQLYACELELGAEYSLTNLIVDDTNETKLSLDCESITLYLTPDAHTIILTTADGTELEFTVTYSDGAFVSAAEESQPVQNGWTAQSYTFTVDGQTATTITAGKAYTVSGYASEYGEVQYLYSDSENGTYTATAPTAAGTYYVMAYVPAGDGYTELYGTAQEFTITAAASDQSYTITLVSLGEVVDTLTYTVGVTLLNANIKTDNITAPAGFDFYAWEYADGSTFTTITISGDVTLYARYVAKLTLNVEGSGTVYLNGTQQTSGTINVAYGVDYVLTTTPSGGNIAHITVDGSAVQGSTYSFTPAGDFTVTVVFDTNGIEVFVGGSSGVSLGIFATIEEAVAAADGYSIVYMALYTDVIGSAEITGNVTVNLNGYTWDADGTIVYGNLTIIDEEVSRVVAVASLLTAVSGGVVEGTLTLSGGTLTLNGGTVEYLYIEEGTAYVTAGTVAEAYVAANTTLDISGGNVLSVTAAGEVVSGSKQLYSLQIPVSGSVTSIIITYSDGSTSSYEATAIGGTVYLWLSSDAEYVTIDGTTHACVCKNGVFTLTNAWISAIDESQILTTVKYGETAISDDLLATVEAMYGTAKVQYSTDNVNWTTSYPSSAGYYYIRVYVEAGANYTSLASNSIYLTIEKNDVADPSLFTYTLPSSLVYDAGAKQVVVETNMTIGGLTVYYSTDGVTWTTTQPTLVGTYYFAIDVEGTDSVFSCEKLRDDGWTFTITPYIVSNPVADTTEFVYSGSIFTYSLAASDLYVITDSSRIEAGTYVVTVTLKDNVNYVWEDDDGDGVITYMFVINKATIQTPEADGSTYTYDGTMLTYIIAASDYYSVSGNSQRNAGTYTVVVSLTDKNNYCWSTGNSYDVTFTFTIGKAAANLTAEDLTITYGDDVNVTWSASSDGEVTIVYYLDGTESEITAAGEYSIVITIAETDNYYGGTVTVTLTVNKVAQQTASASSNASASEELEKGSSYTVSVAGLNVYDGTLTYTSSDESVAVVDSDGNVTIVGIGTYAITVSLTGDSRYDDWSYTFDEITIHFDFTPVIIGGAAALVVIIAAAVVIMLILKRKKRIKTEQANILELSQAIEQYAETAAQAAEESQPQPAYQPAYGSAVRNTAATVETSQPAAAPEAEQKEDKKEEQPLTEKEAALLKNRYRENENLIRKIGWGAEES